MLKQSILPLVNSSLSIASTQLFVPNAVFGQQKNMEASTLCGTWQAIPGSGDFIYGPEDSPVKKIAGKIKGTVNYDIHTVSIRTFRATKTVSIETPFNVDGSRLGGSKTRTIDSVVKYHGAVQGDSMYLTDDSESGIEKWLRLPGNKFDVIVLHDGKYDSTAHFIVEQTSKQSCK